MECGHGGICYECGKHLLATEPHVCHLCRESINYVLKMDLSTVYSDFIKVISATFIEQDQEKEETEDQAFPDQQNESPVQNAIDDSPMPVEQTQSQQRA